MRYLALVGALMSFATVARAQDAIPDIKGTWSGKGKSIVFGNNPHHPGTQTAANPPRVRDFEFTFVVDGQDGRLAWGHSLSTAATTNEPFGWAISADNKTIIGVDTDGYPGPRPDRDVLRPQRAEPDRLHGRDLLRHDADQDVRSPAETDQ
jgi:hypothetical protein